MKADTRTNFFVLCSVSLACLMLCGCFEEQSYSNNRQKYSASMPVTIDGANYALVVDDALAYVDKHSTERMKKYISRGKLAAGMNQKEVIACLQATNFRDGLPVLSKTIKSKYGKYETWIVGGSSGDKYASYSSPKYALDFTYYILTCVHEAKASQVNDNLHLARAE